MNTNNSNINIPKNRGNGNGISSLIFYFFVIIIVLLIVLLLVFLIQYLKVPCEGDRVNFLDYLLGLDVYANPCLPCDKPIEKEECPDGLCDMEIVHIPRNIYTYPQAKHKCELSGGTLATKQQMIDAYNKGGSWQNYGWSADMNAYYLVQPCDFVKMRKRGIKIAPPGVAGGRFRPGIRFGINCYMRKPEGAVKETKLCKDELDICARNPKACEPIGSDNISPFNPKQWSECN